ncbi:MAG: tRNA (adenosine(37)-N6)-threonylcarbamoyltransferase complex ATPase subunit type 1 TsaE [Candidatus Hydrogenedentes bacterium]|nr:tRNA (adenosine(37)-N6)-threonylcarbamoyltransferase complex ATPase subunit type 1 TsaE [Candidatus Hydrogenedentota bacterium]
MSSESSVVLTTRSPEETERLGEALARLMPTGGTVALRGELASGKTCFVRGMARAVAGDPSIHSPTFTLINEYGSARKLFHLDLYRLGSIDEVAELGVEELFDSASICAVEWAERAELLLPAKRVDVHFDHAGEDRRTIEIGDRGMLAPGWRETIRDLQV